MQKTQSTDPLKLALAMEDMALDTSVGKVRMRGQDHQLLLAQVVNTIAPVDGKRVTQGWEGTQWGFRTDAVVPAEQLTLSSTCQMQRPTRR